MGKVIYDPECPYCVTISKIVDLSDRFETLSFQSDEATELLEEEFEDPGFTFYLVQDSKIYYGDRAAQKTAEKLYRSKIFGKIFLILYPYLSKLFSVLSRRRGVKLPECTDERCLVDTGTGGVLERKP